MVLSKVINTKYMESFTSTIVKNGLDKQFWFNKLKALSYVDIAILSIYGGLELYYKFFSNLIYSYDEELVDYIHKSLIKFFNDAKNPNLTASKLNEMYDDSNMCSIINKLGGVKSPFQNEKFYLNALDTICELDQRLKTLSLEEMPDHIPSYAAYESLPLSYGSEKINALCSIRLYLVLILEQISHIYSNVPLSIVESIVKLSMNKSCTFGLRRWLPRLLDLLSEDHTPENCMTILKAKGLTILKYYDVIQFSGREMEKYCVERIIDVARPSNLLLPSIPRELKPYLSEQECQLLLSEYRIKAKSLLKTEFLGSVFTFSYTYFKTKSALASISTTLFLSTNLVAITSFWDRFIFVMSGVFIPHCKLISLALAGYDLIETLYGSYIGEKKASYIDYEEDKLDQLVPSIDVVLNEIKK